MHAKHWTPLLFAGCLSVGGIARGQTALPATPEAPQDDQEVLIQPAPPAAPDTPQPYIVESDSRFAPIGTPRLPQPPFALAPGAPAGGLVQIRPDMPGYGGGYRVIEGQMQSLPKLPQPPGGMAPGAPPALMEVQPDVPGYGSSYRVMTRQAGGSWLGVGVSPAPEALRRQLRLRDGAGLVVDQVMPNSPAGRAGIEQYDVLETLDDQPLTNPQELVSIVRSHRSGDEVTLGIIREGKHREVTVKVSRAASNMPRQPQMQGMYPPANPAPRFGGAGGGFWSANPGSLPATPAPKFGAGGGGSWFSQPGAPPAAKPAAPYPDFAPPQPRGQGSSVSLYYRGGQLFATIYDASGRIMMTGPLDALRDQKSLPRDARRALEQLRDGARPDKAKEKPAKVRKHRQSDDEDNDEDDASRDR